MNQGVVILERDGPVAIVRMNRPEKHNALNRELSLAIADTFADLEVDDTVDVIVITGAGERAFCAGADMAERTQAPAGTELAQGRTADVYGAVSRATKPVIA